MSNCVQFVWLAQKLGLPARRWCAFFGDMIFLSRSLARSPARLCAFESAAGTNECCPVRHGLAVRPAECLIESECAPGLRGGRSEKLLASSLMG